MDRIKFNVNGIPHTVGSEVSTDVTLLDYIRGTLELRGTKYMCREAGCGACIVAAVKTPGGPTVAVNACMVQITSCHDWQITTTEALGDRSRGYHVLHRTLAEHNGTQCGYCTPAWIMAMYSLLQSKEDLTMLEIEQSFASNVCRCTGVYPIFEYPRTLIDISSIKELKVHTIDQNLIIGAGLTLTEILDIFKNTAQHEYFSYLQQFYEHLRLVAHLAVRNIGSLGGNLMIKHQHNEFQSDLFLLLATVGAQLTIVNSHGLIHIVTMEEFLTLNMRGQVILNALLPPLSKDNHVVTYKVMPRSQNAYAIVNAGFLFSTRSSNHQVQRCRVVYGGLSSSYTRAPNTEKFLVGKALFRNETLQAALKILESELVVTARASEPSVQYRKKLAVALFYKGLLTVCPRSILDRRYHSGSVKLHESRPVSDARQIFTTNPTLWPLNQPIPKIEALVQCSGEARYVDDIPTLPYEVFAAFVLSTVPLGDIDNINPNRALKYPGVIAFYSAKDIPGENNFTPGGSTFYTSDEEVFCSNSIKYFNQPIGIVVAETQQIADRAAKLVDVRYKNVKKPVIDVKITKKDPNRVTLLTSADATETGTDAVKIIKGENTIYGQYHFVMETLVCVTKPTEEGLEVHTAGQWMDGTQWMISRALNMDKNRIDVHVKRLGGAYGLKISRSIQVAVACSLVVQKLNRPCRLISSLTNNTRAFGKRLPCSTDFEFGVDSSGTIQYMNYNLYEDNGYKVNETLSELGVDVFYNCYNNSRWNYRCYNATTDTAKNTWCRSPGTLENIAMAEYIVEQISYEMSLDPFDVRLANLNDTRFGELREMTETIKTTSKYIERKAEVKRYNSENRWKKRGLRIAFLRWTPIGSQTLDVNMSVFHGDGSVIITHGGIEMGQGLNTKAVQICAYFLKIPIDKIQIKSNSTIIAPNGFISGGSVTSQSVGIGVRRCCEALLLRLEPVRTRLNDPTWEELIKTAFESNVDLQVHGFVSADDAQSYNIFGITVAEVEVDILTGESEVLRVDLLQDVGLSVSPEVDIGQVEGAFIMGLGYWTSENLIYEPNTGELLTDRTWNYHVPQARDIPQDFRVYFQKNSYSNELILGAKGTGEPPMCMSIVIAFAIREAIAAARLDSGIPTINWFDIDGPYTLDKIALAANSRKEDFKFY